MTCGCMIREPLDSVWVTSDLELAIMGDDVMSSVTTTTTLASAKRGNCSNRYPWNPDAISQLTP